MTQTPVSNSEIHGIAKERPRLNKFAKGNPLAPSVSRHVVTQNKLRPQIWTNVCNVFSLRLVCRAKYGLTQIVPYDLPILPYDLLLAEFSAAKLSISSDKFLKSQFEGKNA
eukprot:2663585-Amphidinium_carterae.1